MLITRVLAAAVFTPAILVLIWFGGLGLQIACAALGKLMLWEYLQLILGKGFGYMQSFSYALGALVLAAMLGWGPPLTGLLLMPVATLTVLCAVLLRPEPIPQSMQRAALALLGVAYSTGLIPFLVRLRDRPDGLGLTLMALLCTWGSDTGAYFAGRAFGKHKLYPLVSPGKTVEGSLGGLVSAVVAALALRAVLHLPVGVGHSVALAVVAACFGALGDLCESLLKRSVGAKDSSHLIPGHGGVLDRFDGVMFAVPAFYIYVVLFV